MPWWRKPIVSVYWSEAKLSQSKQSILLVHMLSEKGAESITQGITLGEKRLLSVMNIWHVSVSGLIYPKACINSPLKLGRESKIKATYLWRNSLVLSSVSMTYMHAHTQTCPHINQLCQLEEKFIIRMENSAWHLFIYIFHQGLSLSFGKLWSSFRTQWNWLLHKLSCIYLTFSNGKKCFYNSCTCFVDSLNH